MPVVKSRETRRKRMFLRVIKENPPEDFLPYTRRHGAGSKRSPPIQRTKVNRQDAKNAKNPRDDEPERFGREFGS